MKTSIVEVCKPAALPTYPCVKRYLRGKGVLLVRFTDANTGMVIHVEDTTESNVWKFGEVYHSWINANNADSWEDFTGQIIIDCSK